MEFGGLGQLFQAGCIGEAARASRSDIMRSMT
jgi:hypothetical protein